MYVYSELRSTWIFKFAASLYGRCQHKSWKGGPKMFMNAAQISWWSFCLDQKRGDVDLSWENFSSPWMIEASIQSSSSLVNMWKYPWHRKKNSSTLNALIIKRPLRTDISASHSSHQVMESLLKHSSSANEVGWRKRTSVQMCVFHAFLGWEQKNVL